jgi:hypothetical protein
MGIFPSCKIVFVATNGPRDAFPFFSKLSGVIPILFDAELLGTPEEIKRITGDPNEKSITIRSYNGQISFEEGGEPNGFACQVGYLERECTRYIRFDLDLRTGLGTIERID